MAEAHSVDDLTHCPICFEKYDRPRYLPCLHTFCEKCLQTYIDTTVGNDSKTEGFNCPTCRRLIVVPASEDVQWGNLAETFPLNHLIVTLMDITLSAENLKFCGPCRKRSIEVPPMSWCTDCKEFLCGQCVEYHKTLPILEGHLIETLKDINEVDVISTPTFHCEKHPDKKLEMFCEDHDIPCCMSCTMIEHRKCDKVETLEKAAKRKNLSLMREEITERFSNVLESLNERIKMKTDSFNDFNDQCDEMKHKVQETTEGIRMHVKHLCSNALTELSTIKEKQERLYISDIELLKEQKVSIERYQNLLTAKEKDTSDVQSFMEMRRLKEYIEDIPKEQVVSNKYCELNFEIDNDVLDIMKVETLLKPKRQEHSNTSDDTASLSKCEYKSFEYLRTLNFRDRKKNISVNNCVFLENGGLLIVDYRNAESRNGFVRLYNSELSQFQTIRLMGKPWAAVELDVNSYIITIPSNKSICYLETETYSTIEAFHEESSTFYENSGRKFFGIAMKDKPSTMSIEREATFYVSSRGEVHLRTRSGFTLQKLNLSTTYIQHISYKDGAIYFSAKDSLYCVDEDGNAIFEFNDPTLLQGASGSSVGYNGDIAVCGRKSDLVVIIDRFGKRKTEVAVNSPTCVAFSSDCYKMCVVRGGTHIDNLGAIFEIEYNN